MTNLGMSPPVLIYQAARTFNHLPSGPFNSPSMMYLAPNIVFSSTATSLSDACCFRARASASHRSRSNPNCMKNEALLLPARCVVESKYLVILLSGISAFSTFGSLIVPSYGFCSCGSNGIPRPVYDRLPYREIDDRLAIAVMWCSSVISARFIRR